MSKSSVMKGSCLCGAVKLSTTSLSDKVGACHCNMCRKWGGSAMLALECESDVNWEGQENIGVYQSSEWAERGFCKNCGSHLFYKLKINNHYYIPVGMFNDAKGLIFDHQVFIDEKPDYYEFANETQKMTGAEVFEEFVPLLEGTEYQYLLEKRRL